METVILFVEIFDGLPGYVWCFSIGWDLLGIGVIAGGGGILHALRCVVVLVSLLCELVVRYVYTNMGATAMRAPNSHARARTSSGLRRACILISSRVKS